MNGRLLFFIIYMCLLCSFQLGLLLFSAIISVQFEKSVISTERSHLAKWFPPESFHRLQVTFGCFSSFSEIEFMVILLLRLLKAFFFLKAQMGFCIKKQFEQVSTRRITNYCLKGWGGIGRKDILFEVLLLSLDGAFQLVG